MTLTEIQVKKIMQNIAWERGRIEANDTEKAYARTFVNASEAYQRLMLASAVRIIEARGLERYFL